MHAAREARRTACARCGSYACEECFGSDRETLCVSCRERVGGVIAWEADDAGHVLARGWATVTQAIPAPFSTFEGVRDGEGLLSALWFATFVNVVSYGVPMLLCAPCLVGAVALIPRLESETAQDTAFSIVPIMVCSAAAFPMLMAGFAVLLSLIVGLVYHLAAVIAGGTASLVSSLRAALFLNALAPVSAASWILGRIPLIGILVSLATLVGSVVWQTFALAGHARGAHGINDNRAWLVGAVPAVLTLAMMAAAVFLVLALAFADGSGLLEDID